MVLLYLKFDITNALYRFIVHFSLRYFEILEIARSCLVALVHISGEIQVNIDEDAQYFYICFNWNLVVGNPESSG